MFNKFKIYNIECIAVILGHHCIHCRQIISYNLLYCNFLHDFQFVMQKIICVRFVHKQHFKNVICYVFMSDCLNCQIVKCH